MEKEFVEFCKQNRIAHGDVKTYATPRRLTLTAQAVADSQTDKVTEIKGPPAQAAVDPQGKFTPAASKFAESRGGDIKNLEVRETEKGKYIFLTIKEKGVKTAKALPELPAWIIGKMGFPKNMRWDVRKVNFARPVRWIALLYGDKAVKVQFEGIPSGAFTFGNRYFGSKRIPFKSVAEYFEKLEAVGVIVDHRRRMEMIRDGVGKLAGGKPHMTPDLLRDVTFLVEYPYLGVGTFPEEYTKLPREVIIICIEKNQHYFPIEDLSGNKMLPRFVVVMNVPLTDNKTVVGGYEKVLNSRLKDALFFYEQDLKTPLAQRVESLGRITFQEKLGSLLDKTKRVENLVSILGDKMNLGAHDIKIAKEAAWLMKADLTTQMVFEYTEIQGTVGKYYALQDGINPYVAQAIEEHYMPRFAEDELPETMPGALLAIADKLDTIVGYFIVGMIPTGSADPYQLRRSALGIIRILEKFQFEAFDNGLFDDTLNNYKNMEIIAKEGLDQRLIAFLKDRKENYWKSEGYEYDVIRAALGRKVNRSSLAKTRKLMDILAELRETESFQNFLEVYTRISNIIKNAGDKNVKINPELFENDEEKKLFEKSQEVESFIEGESDDRKRIDKLFELTLIVNSFFEKVLVNAEDLNVKDNRIQILQNTKYFCDKIADFSCIVKKS